MAPESFALDCSDIRRKGSCRREVRQSNIERSESGREGSDPRRQVPEGLSAHGPRSGSDPRETELIQTWQWTDGIPSEGQEPLIKSALTRAPAGLERVCPPKSRSSIGRDGGQGGGT